MIGDVEHRAVTTSRSRGVYSLGVAFRVASLALVAAVRGMGLLTIRRRAFMAGVTGCLGAARAAFAVSPSAAFAGWLGGNASENTYSTNCVTGTDYTERATAQVVGYLAPDAGGVPKVGEVYYVDEMVTAIGNACPDGYYALDMQLHLPANTYPAASSTNPIQCWITLNNGTVVDSNSHGFGCPTDVASGDWPDPTSGWLRIDPNSARAGLGLNAGVCYPVSGQSVEVDVPVYSTVPLGGLGDHNSFLVGAVSVPPFSAAKPDRTYCAVRSDSGPAVAPLRTNLRTPRSSRPTLQPSVGQFHPGVLSGANASGARIHRDRHAVGSRGTATPTTGSLGSGLSMTIKCDARVAHGPTKSFKTQRPRPPQPGPSRRTTVPQRVS